MVRLINPTRIPWLLGLSVLSAALSGCPKAEERETCDSDSECDDGVFCNGEERCAPESPAASYLGCIPGIPCEKRVGLRLFSGPVCFEQDEICLFEDSSVCASDVECQDGVYCNGFELCAPDDTLANEFGCIGGAQPCEPGECDEAQRQCVPACPDRDGDGVSDVECGGSDCDDTDASRYPGNTEICDDGHDEDCDPMTFGELDDDGDGFVDTLCRNGDNAGTDCDDGDPGVNPEAVEVCNGRDDDCDGDADEGVALMVYPDADFDGYGETGSSAEQSCSRPGVATNAYDCDDQNPYLKPGGIRCVAGGQGNEIERCDKGVWIADTCDDGNTFRSCEPQPTGLGVCIP